MKNLRRLVRTTSVRLTLIYMALFSLLALGLVFYVSYNTGHLIVSQVRSAAEDEVRDLALVYRTGGSRALIRSIERRSRNPHANLYLVSDQRGRIITGNVKTIDQRFLTQDGWNARPFLYEPFNSKPGAEYRAIAQVFVLPGGLRLLVGRDVGDAVAFRSIVAKASTIALGTMFLTGVLLWFFVGRRALKRLDAVSAATEEIVGGDLAQRLPLSGSDDEFDRLSKNLNSIIQRIETLNTGVSNVSDAIAHDLKTPLTRLRNHAETLQRRIAEGEKLDEADAGYIVGETDNLLSTFNALLTISQATAGARNFELKPVALNDVLADVAELFEPLASEHDFEFEYQPSSPATILANRELIAQLVWNLLDNARKYGLSDENRRIRLSASTEGDAVTIEVRDWGGGIPNDQLEKVKGRFIRLDESRSEPGSGLGLSLVDAIAHLHEGTFSLREAAPGLEADVQLKAAKPH